MSSLIAWLDTTPEEQRAARELISLFSENESRDELGIGQIRDALSDLLFPGTSVVQTRARYYLFIPWCYTAAAARGTSDNRNRSLGSRQERELIKTLMDAELEDRTGLIGGRVGPSVKNLPSAIYWSGMERYGVLARAGDASHLGLSAAETEGATELAERAGGDWHPGVPPAPEGFPQQLDGGFALTRDEAQWLLGRMTSADSSSVLSHLLDRRKLIVDADFAWDAVPRDDFEALDHSYWFSNVIYGASLLYNLLVAEAYEQNSQLTRVIDPVADYHQRIAAWSEEFLVPHRDALAGWDTERLWELTLAVNPNISRRTRRFIESWHDGVLACSPDSIATDRTLRTLVRDREERKGTQSRLLNKKMLATWSGASGTGRLGFRWGTVTTLVNDVLRGLGSDAVA